jgi:hypothetical protein
MFFRAFTTGRAFASAQILVALALFASLALMPPARGTIMLIPIGARAQGELAMLAMAHGASLVQRGPFPESLIVYGERARLFAPLTRAGVLVLAGGAAGCRSTDIGA